MNTHDGRGAGRRVGLLVWRTPLVWRFPLATAWCALVVLVTGNPAADTVFLPGPDGAATGFGQAVVTTQGVILIGSPSAFVDGSEAGRVVVSRQTSAGWQREPSPLTATWGASAGDHYGAAIAAGGPWIAIGAPDASGRGGPRCGRVEIRFDDGDGLPQRIGVAEPGSATGTGTGVGVGVGGTAGGAFGKALAFGGTVGAAPDRLAIGAPFTSVAAGRASVPLAGRVYLYERIGFAWRHRLTLESDSPAIAQAFGSSLAFVGDRVVVGVPGDSTLAPGAGRVDVFDATSGELVLQIRPSDLSFDTDIAGARFGAAIAAIDDASATTCGSTSGSPSLRIAIGAPGRGRVAVVHVDGSISVEDSMLCGDPIRGFGNALASHGGLLAVGAPFDLPGQPHRGVWLYRACGGASDAFATETQSLPVVERWQPVPFDRPKGFAVADGRSVVGPFGHALALDERHLVIGGPELRTVDADRGLAAPRGCAVAVPVGNLAGRCRAKAAE